MNTKITITDELLKRIEEYAMDEYSLLELFEEIEIPNELLQNKQILRAFELGLQANYVRFKIDNISDKDIIDSSEISVEQCILWAEKHNEVITLHKEKKAKQIKLHTRQISNPLTSGINNIITQNKNSPNEVSAQQLASDVESIVKKLQNGETQDLLTTLVMNNMQLQIFDQSVAENLMGEAGKKIDNYEILSKIQLRVMNEVRKNIMAMNEICNPKRATFIKEANQHNHLHQENSQKKLENENELQKTEQLEAPAVVTDAEIMPLKDKVQ